MAKYYVQSGSMKMVLDAKDSTGAVLWAMHSRLSPISCIYNDSDYTDEQQIDQVMMQAMIELEPTVSISERGFDRADAETHETFEMALKWHQLAKAMAKLEGNK